MIWGVLACALIFIAIAFARKRNYIRHKHVMLLMLGGGWSFVVFYLVGYISDQSYSETVPAHLVSWLTIHGILGLLTLLMVTLLIWARLSAPGRAWADGESEVEDTLAFRSYINRHHKAAGTVTALLWLITQAGGFINLYILR